MRAHRGENLEDYVLHARKSKPLTEFDEKFTVPAAGTSNWEQTLKEVRAKHFEYAKGATASDQAPTSSKTRLAIQSEELIKTQKIQKASYLQKKQAHRASWPSRLVH